MWIPLPTSIETARGCARLLLAFFIAMGPSTSAFAEPPPQERALATALFEEGRGLMAKGNFAAACPKLAESYRLHPLGGTLLNLALCHGREGKIATAWIEFREAEAAARRDKRPDREAAATTEIQKLEPRLSRLSILVSPEVKLPGLSIKLDNAPLSEAAWGTQIPINPGKHSIVAEAPGHRSFETTVEIGPNATEPTVTLPPLAAEGLAPPHAPLSPPGTLPPPAVSAPAKTNALPPPPPSLGSRQRIAGYVLGGLGVVGLGFGAGFGVAAISRQKDSNAICPGKVCNPDQAAAIELNRDAKTYARVSDIAFGVGAAGALAGAILVLTAPHPKNAVAVRASFDRRSGSVSLQGAF
jgi:serine/threonine-protein kinase